MILLPGLANPAPIIQTFYAEDEIFNDVKLDGVVTLVDAKHARLHLDEVKPKGVVNEAVEQIAYADRIIVNKVTKPCYFQEDVIVPTYLYVVHFSQIALTRGK